MDTKLKKKTHQYIDHSGQRFGRWLVLKYARTVKKTAFFLCRCDCGKEVEVRGDNLRRGRSISCGCYRRDITPTTAPYKHGLSNTPEHSAWHGMIRRCYNPSFKHYKNYGGRGITVCDRWKNSYEAFWADMGPRPSPKHSLDRIDNNGNYEPQNCRWVTHEVQCRNTRRNRWLEYNGERRTLADWADHLKIKPQTLHNRLANNWTLDRLIKHLEATPKTAEGRGHRE